MTILSILLIIFSISVLIKKMFFKKENKEKLQVLKTWCFNLNEGLIWVIISVILIICIWYPF